MTLETKIPPPLVGVLIGLLMWIAGRLLPAAGVTIPGRLGIVPLLVVAGLVLAGAGVRALRRASTTLNPLHPEEATAFVAQGIYRYSRNPMYLGMLLWLLAWGLYLSNAASLVLALVFIPYMNRFQIGPEERALGAQFGDSYADYRQRVRRWL